MSSLSTRQGQHKSIRSSFSSPFPTFGGKKKIYLHGASVQEPGSSQKAGAARERGARVFRETARPGSGLERRRRRGLRLLHPRGLPRPSIPAALPPPTPGPPTPRRPAPGPRAPSSRSPPSASACRWGPPSCRSPSRRAAPLPCRQLPAPSSRGGARRVRGALPAAAAATAGGGKASRSAAHRRAPAPPCGRAPQSLTIARLTAGRRGPRARRLPRRPPSSPRPAVRRCSRDTAPPDAQDGPSGCRSPPPPPPAPLPASLACSPEARTLPPARFS